MLVCNNQKFLFVSATVNTGRESQISFVTGAHTLVMGIRNIPQSWELPLFKGMNLKFITSMSHDISVLISDPEARIFWFLAGFIFWREEGRFHYRGRKKLALWHIYFKSQ